MSYNKANDTQSSSAQSSQLLGSRTTALTSQQNLQSLVASHPLCSVSAANWHACNDLLDVADIFLSMYPTAADNAALAQAVRNDKLSLGTAHAFLADGAGKLTHTDSLLRGFEGSMDVIGNLGNCTRISGLSACLQVWPHADGKATAMSFLIGNFTMVTSASGRRRFDVHGMVDAAAEGAVRGAVSGAIDGALGGPDGIVGGAIGGAAEGAAEGAADYVIENYR